MSDDGQGRPDSQTTAHSERQRGAARGTAGKFMLFIGSNWIRTVLTLVVGFIMAPLLIGSFGVVLFGLYMLINSFTAAMVMPIRMALSQLFVKSMTVATAAGDDRRVAEVFTNVVAMIFVTAGFFVGVSVVIAAFAPSIIDFPGNHEIHVRHAVIAEALTIGLLVLRTPWLGLFTVEHRAVSFNIDVGLIRWIELLAFGLALLPAWEDHFLAYMWIRVVLMAVHCSIRILLGRRLVRAARIRLALLSRRVIRSLLKTGALTTAQPFSAFAFDALDHYLLNIVFGPVFNAIYAVVNALRGPARRFGAEISVGSEAISADMHERGRHETIVRSLLGIMRLASGVMVISAGVVALFFGPIVDVWLGSRLSKDKELLAIMSYEEAIDLSWIFVVMLLLGGVLMEVCIAGSRFLYGMGLIGKYSGVLFAAGLSKLALAVGATILLLSPWELQFMPDKGSVEAVLLFPATTLLCQLVFFGVLFPRPGGPYVYLAAVELQLVVGKVPELEDLECQESHSQHHGGQ